MDCSRTFDFIRERERMCEFYRWNCKECGLGKLHNKQGKMTCMDGVSVHIENAIRIVQDWSDNHPIYHPTYIDIYLEEYPNAVLADGIPNKCMSEVFKDGFCEERYFCHQCWLLPYQGEKINDCDPEV